MSPAQLPQPFNFYKIILSGDALHYGYWPEDAPELSMEQAQQALTDLLCAQLPPAPARVLDVGCGLGAASAWLHKQGYAVVALAPSDELIAYAEAHNAGPTYLVCGFLDEQPLLQAPEQYDVIMLQESLQYFSDTQAVFSKIKSLLRDADSRVIICDEVSYNAQTQAHSVVKDPKEIEGTFSALGFYCIYHKKIGKQVLKTCAEAVQRFADKRDELLAASGDTPPGLEHFVQGWQYLREAYEKALMGYEVWTLRCDEFVVRGYQTGDEEKILAAFHQAFGTQRQMAHWYWKYRDNPVGRFCISTAWQDDTLVAHYSGYPLRFSVDAQQTHLTQHVGDTFSVRAFRGAGHGASNLLARVFRHFVCHYVERQMFFGYGFNTNKIRRLGQLFLGYEADTAVYNWQLKLERLALYRRAKLRLVRLRGYSVSRETQAGAWADSLWQRARPDYPWLLQRDQAYLHWRYDLNPDFEYEYYVVKHWGRVVGWWLLRQQDNHLALGDALFCRNHATTAIAAGLSTMLHQYPDTQMVEGWFAQTPPWWTELLRQAGFTPVRQRDNLYFCLKSYTPDVTPAQIAARFYFTWGDSDLF